MFHTKRNLFGALLVVFLMGCGNGLKDKIIKDADQKCVGRADSNCLVVITDITKFHWGRNAAT
jgi:hypothetical protein